MKIKIFQVDAFANSVFNGNPAAICPLDYWLPDDTLQSIALENNLSETAFFIPLNDGYHIRWFTPSVEVDLCGHATLASAFVICEYLNLSCNKVNFHSKSGELIVLKKNNRYTLNFPCIISKKIKTPKILIKALGINPIETMIAKDCIVLLESEEAVKYLSPDFYLLKQFDTRGILVTAKGNNCDFVSRCFFPRLSISEDPVTGSAYCSLIPFWAKKLNKTSFFAKQISFRGGELWCKLKKNRTEISGNCVLYLRGQIEI